MARAGFSGDMAVTLGMLDEACGHRITRVIDCAGLPVAGMSLSVNDVIHSMFFDKKVKAGKVRFILPDRIGHVVIRDDVPPETVTDAVKSLR